MSCVAISTAAPSAATWRVSRRRGTNATATARPTTATFTSQQQRLEARVLAPHAERRLAIELEADRLARRRPSSRRRPGCSGTTATSTTRANTMPNEIHERSREPRRGRSRTAARARAARTSRRLRARSARRGRAVDVSASSAYTSEHRDQRVVAVRSSAGTACRGSSPSRRRAPGRACARRGPRRSRSPSRNSPMIVSTSNASAAARAAGSS